MIKESGILRGDEFISTETLNERALRAATALDSIGVGSGDAVALLLRNDIPFFEATLAAGAIGAASVPQNWHGKPEDVLGILRDCKAKVVVAHADLLRPVLGLIPEGMEIRVVPTPDDIGKAYGIAKDLCAVPDGLVAWDTWVDEFDPWPDAPVPAPGAMMYTSGTTGNPKGVRRKAKSAEAMTEDGYYSRMAEYFGVVPGARAVVTGPMYHGAPHFWGLGWVRAGGFVVLQAKFDPEDLLRIIEEQQVSSLYLVPIMYSRLLKLPVDMREKFDVSSLRHVTNAAAPCPRHVKQAMIDWWGPVVYEMYGSLETGVCTGATAQEWMAHPGTVGKALPGVEVKILDADGNEMPIGEPGEIYTQIAQQPDFEYEGRPDARAEMEKDGFLTAGDIGYLDDDGFLYLSDRKKDMVISGGVNIYPPAVEEVLLTMPGVRDVAVFGIPDEEFGESVAAAVELDGTVEVTAGDVQMFIRDRMATFNAPKVVDFINQIPRLDSGKILKRELREPYWAATGRTI
ncbi:long-chain acyl-CoA synthetase [Antricoccus suffuscus]|uniref:Long-chain acyl-CoA synthetase n=1 Tax=Antricoccus suffuscus TaxID=1629062 RepID=A0A2T0ZTL1_9ACTN|nr:AMP-binding protein [Antricoccus suffuscus]PRZ39691.1 long-chain acyl-CoA synthetase [Antricoccus suffuscus]